MPRMRGSAISGKPFRRGSLDLDTKAPLKRIRSSVNLWFDKVFGDVHLSPCPLEQVLGDDRPPDRRGRGHNGCWRARPQWGTTTVQSVQYWSNLECLFSSAWITQAPCARVNACRADAVVAPTRMPRQRFLRVVLCGGTLLGIAHPKVLVRQPTASRELPGD